MANSQVADNCAVFNCNAYSQVCDTELDLHSDVDSLHEGELCMFDFSLDCTVENTAGDDRNEEIGVVVMQTVINSGCQSGLVADIGQSVSNYAVGSVGLQASRTFVAGLRVGTGALGSTWKLFLLLMILCGHINLVHGHRPMICGTTHSIARFVQPDTLLCILPDTDNESITCWLGAGVG
jgi:hypothetical protein